MARKVKRGRGGKVNTKLLVPVSSDSLEDDLDKEKDMELAQDEDEMVTQGSQDSGDCNRAELHGDEEKQNIIDEDVQPVVIANTKENLVIAQPLPGVPLIHSLGDPFAHPVQEDIQPKQGVTHDWRQLFSSVSSLGTL